MAFSQQPQYQQQQQQQQQHQHREEQLPNLTSAFYLSSLQAAFLNPCVLPGGTHYPPLIPPFQVTNLEPAPVEQLGGGGGGGGGELSLNWNFGLEPKKEHPEEQDFLEDRSNNLVRSNSQMSSVDFLSTGLGLSLANNYSTSRLPFSGDFLLPVSVAEEINREFQRQDDEVSRYLKIQGDHLKQVVLEKFQSYHMNNLAYVEERVQERLREKETEVETFKKKTIELETKMERLALEAASSQQRAQYNEAVINNLKFKLHMALTQNKDEGCGDSEIDDSASSCNGDGGLSNMGIGLRELMCCKVCRMKRMCILVLPCKHLCLCKECDNKVSSCPICHNPKYIGLEVYM